MAAMVSRTKQIPSQVVHTGLRVLKNGVPDFITRRLGAKVAHPPTPSSPPFRRSDSLFLPCNRSEA